MPLLPSFGTIFSIAAQIIILVCVSVLYVFFVSVLCPSLFLKPKYNAALEGDRGLKKYLFEGGRAIVYEPSVEVKKYIKQYILTAISNEKYIQCKFDPHIFSSKYEVYAFDCNDQMIDAVQIEEPHLDDGRGISQAVLLPTTTAYVRVSVKSVNEVKILWEPMVNIPASQVALFTLFTVLGTVVEAFIMKVILMDIAKNIFSDSFLTEDYGNLFTLILAVIAGFILSFFGRLLHGLNKREKEDLKMQSRKKIRK